MNLFPTFRELGYGLGFSDRGQKPIASGHWEEVRPSSHLALQLEPSGSSGSSSPLFIAGPSWVLAKSLSFPFPRPQFPNMGKSSQESWSLLPQSQNLWLSSKVFAILFIFCLFFFKDRASFCDSGGCPGTHNGMTQAHSCLSL